LKTRYFIVSPDAERQGTIVLDGPEFHHGVRVSRVRVGEIVRLIDGRGGVFEARVESIGSDRAIMSVRTFERAAPLPPVDIALGIVKAPRLEIAVEKCTELGARAIIPIASERCVWRGDEEETARKLDRMRRKMLASCKQSGRPHFPVIEPVVDIDAVARRIPSYKAAFLADPSGSRGIPPLGITAAALGIVGPEGGFSPRERNLLIAAGAIPISLGRTRLRGETAAICLLCRLLSEYRDSNGG
jgi:16S rRNA (uracil1498-N3)-methyltransferase